MGTGSLTDLDLDALSAGAAPWPDFLRAWLSSWAGSATFVAYLALAVLYPTGRFDEGRGRVGKLLLGFAIVSFAAQALAPSFSVNPEGTRSYLVPNRFGVIPDAMAALGLTGDWWTILTIVLLAAAVIDLVLRFRRSTGLVRVQMRWLVASLCAIVASVVVGLVLTVALGPTGADVAWIPVIVAYPTLPLAVYLAITRYRLYEIDRIVSRTVGWAMVTGLLLAVFAAGIVSFQAILAGITQGQTLAVAVSTVMAFGLFQPVRRRVQRTVDRRFDRARYDGQRMTAVFADRVRNQVDLIRLSRRARGDRVRCGPAHGCRSVAAHEARGMMRSSWPWLLATIAGASIAAAVISWRSTRRELFDLVGGAGLHPRGGVIRRRRRVPRDPRPGQPGRLAAARRRRDVRGAEPVGWLRDVQRRRGWHMAADGIRGVAREHPVRSPDRHRGGRRPARLSGWPPPVAALALAGMAARRRDALGDRQARPDAGADQRQLRRS